MLMNFLHHLFPTKVECSAVSLDGYSVQNLISSNWRKRNQGFMAAHFIKPPVILLVQFPFPIHVHSLVIKPKVGSQISTGIDVFVTRIRRKEEVVNARSETTRKRTRKEHMYTCTVDLSTKNNTAVEELDVKRRRTESKNIATEKVKNIHSNDSPNVSIPIPDFSILITTDSFKTEHRNLFTLVSRVNEQQGRTFRIVNRRYKETQIPYMDEGVAELDFFQAHMLSHVTHLVICINRMKGSCVPALGKLEVWGQPSLSCDQTVQNYALDIYNQITLKNATPEIEFGTKTKSEAKETEYEEDAANDDGIPSEFIDPITCKLMTIPMLLPSGLNIDITTLEKHVEAERQWGRMPSDPFTGVVFSGSTKPLPNSALKVRIDKYILDSNIDTSNFGRTTGRSSSTNHGNAMKRSLKQAVDGNRTELKGKSNYVTRSTIKNKIENDHDVLSTAFKLDVPNQVTQNHEDKISQSLDTALIRTLQGATFIRKPRPLHNVNLSTSSLITDTASKPSTSTALPSDSNINQITNCCAQCKVALDTAFRLPCQHCMCRKCLLLKTSSRKNAACSLCGKQFVHKEVIRVHTS